MRTCIGQVWIWMGLFMMGTALAQDSLSPAEQYKQARLEKRAYERYLYAREMLEQSPDIEVINEAVQDAVRYATNQDEDTKVLQSLESALSRLPADGEAWREAMLARGKMLTRLDRKDEAETFFQDAIQKNWNHAMWRYSESLIDSDYMAEACLLECQRIGGLEKYAKYRGEDESLEIFLTLLRLTKNFDEKISLVDEVSQKLDAIADKPEFVAIAQALCLAEDGNPAEAVAQLDKLDTQLSENKDHREYKHIPLYKASILFKAGTDYPAAEAAFTEFMKRNEGKNQKVIDSSLRIARDLEMNLRDKQKIDEMMIMVINSDFFKNLISENKIEGNDISSIYDLYQQGLCWSEKYEESANICKYVMETYYPQTLAGANCALNYANYIGWIKKDIDQASEIIHKIAIDAPYPEIIPWLNISLAEISFLSKDRNKSLHYIQDTIDNISKREKGNRKYCRELAIKILNNNL